MDSRICDHTMDQMLNAINIWVTFAVQFVSQLTLAANGEAVQLVEMEMLDAFQWRKLDKRRSVEVFELGVRCGWRNQLKSRTSQMNLQVQRNDERCSCCASNEHSRISRGLWSYRIHSFKHLWWRVLCRSFGYSCFRVPSPKWYKLASARKEHSRGAHKPAEKVQSFLWVSILARAPGESHGQTKKTHQRWWW